MKTLERSVVAWGWGAERRVEQEEHRVFLGQRNSPVRSTVVVDVRDYTFVKTHKTTVSGP